MSKKPNIPVASVDLSGNEEAYAVQAIRSTWISSAGEFLGRFAEMPVSGRNLDLHADSPTEG